MTIGASLGVWGCRSCGAMWMPLAPPSVYQLTHVPDPACRHRLIAKGNVRQDPTRRPDETPNEMDDGGPGAVDVGGPNRRQRRAAAARERQADL